MRGESRKPQATTLSLLLAQILGVLWPVVGEGLSPKREVRPTMGYIG
jgi:hypothetical protein